MRVWPWHFEKRIEPLAHRRLYAVRTLAHAGIAAALILVSLAIGIAGYRATEGMSFIDATLNASMILGGMGPVDVLRTNAGKIFASFYSLFSGVVFLVAVGVLIAPTAHRLLHYVHLERGPSEID